MTSKKRIKRDARQLAAGARELLGVLEHYELMLAYYRGHHGDGCECRHCAHAAKHGLPALRAEDNLPPEEALARIRAHKQQLMMRRALGPLAGLFGAGEGEG